MIDVHVTITTFKQVAVHSNVCLYFTVMVHVMHAYALFDFNCSLACHSAFEPANVCL